MRGKRWAVALSSGMLIFSSGVSTASALDVEGLRAKIASAQGRRRSDAIAHAANARLPMAFSAMRINPRPTAGLGLAAAAVRRPVLPAIPALRTFGASARQPVRIPGSRRPMAE